MNFCSAMRPQQSLCCGIACTQTHTRRWDLDVLSLAFAFVTLQNFLVDSNLHFYFSSFFGRNLIEFSACGLKLSSTLNIIFHIHNIHTRKFSEKTLERAIDQLKLALLNARQ